MNGSEQKVQRCLFAITVTHLLSMEEKSQDPQWMPEATWTDPYTLHFLYMHACNKV